jgi:hypothetical protein
MKYREFSQSVQNKPNPTGAPFGVLTLQNFIYKHIPDWENILRNFQQEKEKEELI